MEEQFPFSLLVLNHRDNIVVDEELWKKGNFSCDQTRHFTLDITHIFVGWTSEKTKWNVFHSQERSGCYELIWVTTAMEWRKSSVLQEPLRPYCFMTVFRMVDLSLLFFTAQQPMIFENVLLRFDLIPCGPLLSAESNAKCEWGRGKGGEEGGGVMDLNEDSVSHLITKKSRSIGYSFHCDRNRKGKKWKLYV